MASFDPNRGLHPGPAGSPVRASAVTPSDGSLLPTVARRLYVGGAGDLVVLFRDETVPVTLKNVAVGEHEFWVKQVFATGTTATFIVALA